MLDELIQQKLRADDLVWIEGQSAMWLNPMEVPALKSHVLPALEATDEITGTSVIGDSYLSSAREMERKAEQLRRRAMAALQNKAAILQPGRAISSPKNQKAAPVNEEEDGIQMVYHKHERRIAPIGEFFIFCLITALIVIGWRGGVFSQFFRRPPEDNTVATQLVANENHAARTSAPATTPIGSPSLPLRRQVDSTIRKDSSDSLKIIEPSLASQKPSIKHRSAIRVDSSAGMNSNSTIPKETIASDKNQRGDSKTANVSEEVKKPVLKENALAQEKKNDKTKGIDADTSKSIATAERPEKKKGLGQVLRGLFGGKKKKEAN